jgi:hypothetical protein
MSTNLDKFNEFYKLKTTYENQLDKYKARIIKDKNTSWREKRAEFRKIKPKCLKCSRPVGNIFTIKYDNDSGNRNLKATCGDLVDPCDFFIDYIVPETTLYTNNMTNFENDINNLKNDVIDSKNKLLFGYITSEEAVEEFDKLKEMINDTSSFLEYFIDRFANVANNKVKLDLMNSLKMDINNSYIHDIKLAVENYNSTNDEQYIKDAVDIYVNILTPKLKELRDLQYKKCFVEFNVDSGTYHLVQKKYDIEDIEFGDDIIVNEKGKTKSYSKNKGDDEDEDENIETIHGVKMDKTSLVIDTNNFTFNNGQVVWDNPNYQKVWNTLSSKYKTILANDPDWMVETIEAYVNANKNKKPRTFVRPSNLIIPPKNIGDDNYEFGNNLYNDVFNKLPITQKNTLLTLYSKKDGVINYDMLEDALDNIMMSHLEISKY